jgi:hypothetical protein
MPIPCCNINGVQPSLSFAFTSTSSLARSSRTTASCPFTLLQTSMVSSHFYSSHSHLHHLLLEAVVQLPHAHTCCKHQWCPAVIYSSHSASTSSLARSSRTTASCPFAAAYINGVQPSLSFRIRIYIISC